MRAKTWPLFILFVMFKLLYKIYNYDMSPHHYNTFYCNIFYAGQNGIMYLPILPILEIDTYNHLSTLKYCVYDCMKCNETLGFILYSTRVEERIRKYIIILY